MEYFSSSFNVNHPLLLSVQIVKIKVREAAFEKKGEIGRESYGDRQFPSFTRSSLRSAAAPSPGSGCVGQETVTVHVLLRRMH